MDDGIITTSLDRMINWSPEELTVAHACRFGTAAAPSR